MQIHQRLYGGLRLEVDVLDTGRIEVAILQHLIGCRVPVEPTEDHMARFADLVVLSRPT